MKDEDPWNRLEEMPPREPDKFSKGEIACCVVFLVGVIAGLSLLAAEIIDQFLKLP